MKRSLLLFLMLGCTALLGGCCTGQYSCGAAVPAYSVVNTCSSCNQCSSCGTCSTCGYDASYTYSGWY